MFPVAGVVLWIALGMLAGYIAGQISGTEGPNRSMANMGVGLCAAVVGGAVVTFAQNGKATNAGLGLSIVVAAVTACVVLAIYRALHRGPSSTLR
jgi:uncharacterized membrane protein YeaQ/YmgE (transglycosylase-associated protein family)